MSNPSAGHFLLFTEAKVQEAHGLWRFSLTRVGARESFSAGDFECETCGERLELLALVRGLEAIDEPSRVTLVTNSRYVNRGLKRGLGEWRANGWHWERFGQLVPVRDQDLWRRVDRALQFHELDCRLWRFDHHHDEALSRESVIPPRNPPKLRRPAAIVPPWDTLLHPAELAAG